MTATRGRTTSKRKPKNSANVLANAFRDVVSEAVTEAIEPIRHQLDGRMDHVDERLELIIGRVGLIEQKLDETVTRVDNVESRIKEVEVKLLKHQKWAIDDAMSQNAMNERVHNILGQVLKLIEQK